MSKYTICAVLLSIISLNVNATENDKDYNFSSNGRTIQGTITQNSGGGTNIGDQSSDIERGKWYQFTRDFFLTVYQK